jgi:uncharacterized protein YicC (UPF0701 family)
VEVQSVNHRFLEQRCRSPATPADWNALPAGGAAQFARGHFRGVGAGEGLDGRTRTLKIDLALARQYVESLRTLQQEMNLPGQVTLEMLAGRGVDLGRGVGVETLEEAWAELEPLLSPPWMPWRRCGVRRSHYPGAPAASGRDRWRALAVLGRTSDLVAAHRNRLRERVADLLDGRLPDPLRLEQEVALLAERGDVAEECDRLRSHVAQFRETLDQAGPQGRRLDFLLQEMNREANTIGSKAADASLAQDVVELKTVIERLREQVQNME